MSYISPGDSPTEASVLQAMALLATLSTAAEVRHALLERRAGRDPSTQEEADVARLFLHEARQTLAELVMRMQVGLAYAEDHDEETTAALVRHFDHLMTLRRAGRLFQLVHQRLLSLYPDVSEALVEEARLLQARCEALLEADGAASIDPLADLLDRAPRFLQQLRQELSA